MSDWESTLLPGYWGLIGWSVTGAGRGLVLEIRVRGDKVTSGLDETLVRTRAEDAARRLELGIRQMLFKTPRLHENVIVGMMHREWHAGLRKAVVRRELSAYGGNAGILDECCDVLGRFKVLLDERSGPRP